MSDEEAFDLPCREPWLYEPADWFASSGTTRAEAAKEGCGVCRIRHACATEALEQGIPYGVWGGLDSVERRAVWSNYRTYPAGRPTLFDKSIEDMTRVRTFAAPRGADEDDAA